MVDVVIQDDRFLEKLQEIEDMFLRHQVENKRLTGENVRLEQETKDLKEQIETLVHRVKELEDTAEKSVKGINRVWSRMFRH